MIDRTIAPTINTLVLPKFETPDLFTLSQGIEGVIGVNKDLEVSRVELLFSLGQRVQERPLQGSFTAGQFKRGTENFSEQEIASALERYGAHLEVECRYDYFKVSFYYLNTLFNEVKHIFEDVLLNAKFPEKRLKRSLKAGKSKYVVSHKKPTVIAADVLNQNFYGEAHPYGKIAYAESYETLKREDLISFKKKVLATKPFISLAGNPSKEVLPWLETVLDKMVFTGGFNSGTEAQNGVLNYGEHFKEIKDVNQSAIRMASVGPGVDHPDRIKFRLMATLFGGYFGSRLMKNIREDKGYTYGVHGLPADYYHGSTFNIITEVGAQHTRATLSEIDKEINLLQSESVSDEELDRVKRYNMGEYLRSLDGPFSQTEFYADLHLLGMSYEMLLEYPERIEQVTKNDITEMAQKYLDQAKFVTAIAGKL